MDLTSQHGHAARISTSRLSKSVPVKKTIFFPVWRVKANATTGLYPKIIPCSICTRSQKCVFFLFFNVIKICLYPFYSAPHGVVYNGMKARGICDAEPWTWYHQSHYRCIGLNNGLKEKKNVYLKKKKKKKKKKFLFKKKKKKKKKKKLFQMNQAFPILTRGCIFVHHSSASEAHSVTHVQRNSSSGHGRHNSDVT